MSVKFALIGGKVNREHLPNKIEEEIFKLSGKKTPKVLFCPYAAKDIDKTIKKFHSLVSNLDCEIIDLTFENVGLFDEYLNKADILYISGGVSDDLYEFFIKGSEHSISKTGDLNSLFLFKNALELQIPNDEEIITRLFGNENQVKFIDNYVQHRCNSNLPKNRTAQILTDVPTAKTLLEEMLDNAKEDKTGKKK